jgi:hypothetical protein
MSCSHGSFANSVAGVFNQQISLDKEGKPLSALSHDSRDADRGRLDACAVPSQEQIPSHPGNIGYRATCGKNPALLAFFGPGGFLSPGNGDLPGRGWCRPLPGLVIGENAFDDGTTPFSRPLCAALPF